MCNVLKGNNIRCSIIFNNVQRLTARQTSMTAALSPKSNASIRRVDIQGEQGLHLQRAVKDKNDVVGDK